MADVPDPPPGVDLASEQARVAGLRGEADEVLRGLHEKLAAVREAQRDALATTATATSRDGSVRAVVDATGVVTSLVFAPSAFERGTPERLAQTAVATIQEAARQARAATSRALAPVRGPGSGALAAAARAVPGLDALAVPEVPRTAVDPGEGDPWRREPERAPERPAEPRGQARPTDDDEPGEAGGVLLDPGRW